MADRSRDGAPVRRKRSVIDDNRGAMKPQPPCPNLALVPGEPAGIGPELCVQLAHRERDCTLTAFADARVLRAAADALALPLTLIEVDPHAPHIDGIGLAPGTLGLIDMPGACVPAWGIPAGGNARSVIDALLAAAQGCIDGRFGGVVTGPVHKAAINDGGIAYSGTTELLARHADSDVVMMLANQTMRVALVTTHLPLRAVADAITHDVLTRTLRIVDAALRRDFGLASPRIAVLGLNPHAGEAGHLGREEIEVIEPALDSLRAEGLSLLGPWPADTAFLTSRLREADVVLAMYHDQGLPVLKFSGFEHAVNVTLGLPYPRVAVDHGTALELAGRGIADPSSLLAATALCTRLASVHVAG